MRISITVKTVSHKEKIEKADRGYIVYIKERPVEGRANKAVINLLSEYFDVPKSQISIHSGMKSKQKIIEITT
ncbi:MAG: DUF167 domain-containing protein [Nitrospirae bacterium]|nr:DUF167 domain-containing protein [Nitrospirota bacterium]